MSIDSQHCQVCSRAPSTKLPFYCHRCARDAVYEPRYNLARSLLAREATSREIEQAVLGPIRNEGYAREAPTSSHASEKLICDSARSEYRLIAARTQSLLDDSRHLQEEVETMRRKLAELRRNSVDRRAYIKKVTQETQHAVDNTSKTLQDNISAIEVSWEKLHKRTVHGRHVLPRELTSLYGLEIRRRRKSSSGRDMFVIAGVPVFNLKELNNTAPEVLNASTYHVAHLIHLSAHYLGLRLPAEMSLATAGQPYTYIHPPMSSYKVPTLEFGSRQTSSVKSVPRKRLLWLEKPLPQLASEDSQVCSQYLDAIILLAWNVAWIAKTQGIDVGGKGWEDICLVGKNLWDIFGGSSTDTPDLLPASEATVDRSRAVESNHDPSLSSQASSHSFLNSARSGGGAEYMKAWRYSTPTRTIETIKSALMNERMGADWEVLEMPEEEASAQEHNGQNAGVRRHNSQTTARSTPQAQHPHDNTKA